mmetsp:Transcript_56369/g.182597  ORF Transcript_56369/g.182597 Transcript_56369/m.182597 type:complete len:293 (+) Transcript_56369:2361-3239(+)
MATPCFARSPSGAAARASPECRYTVLVGTGFLLMIGSARSVASGVLGRRRASRRARRQALAWSLACAGACGCPMLTSSRSTTVQRPLSACTVFRPPCQCRTPRTGSRSGICFRSTEMMTRRRNDRGGAMARARSRCSRATHRRASCAWTSTRSAPRPRPPSPPRPPLLPPPARRGAPRRRMPRASAAAAPDTPLPGAVPPAAGPSAEEEEADGKVPSAVLKEAAPGLLLRRRRARRHWPPPFQWTSAPRSRTAAAGVGRCPQRWGAGGEVAARPMATLRRRRTRRGRMPLLL